MPGNRKQNYVLTASMVLACAAGFPLGCGEAPSAPGGASGVSADARTPDRYTVRGVVVGLPSEDEPFQVHHEAIPDFRSAAGEVVGMDVMVMPFPLADGVEVGGLAPGDKVEIELEVTWTGDRPYQATSVVPIDPATPIDLGTTPAGH